MTPPAPAAPGVPADRRSKYLKEMQKGCDGSGVDYVRMLTNRPLGNGAGRVPRAAAADGAAMTSAKPASESISPRPGRSQACLGASAARRSSVLRPPRARAAKRRSSGFRGMADHARRRRRRRTRSGWRATRWEYVGGKAYRMTLNESAKEIDLELIDTSGLVGAPVKMHGIYALHRQPDGPRADPPRAPSRGPRRSTTPMSCRWC